MSLCPVDYWEPGLGRCICEGRIHRANMSYRKELVQVGAVVVAIIEDNDFGVADSNASLTDNGRSSKTQTSPVLSDIFVERQFQDQKWGPQHHEDPVLWLAILMEEVGEVAEEVSSDNPLLTILQEKMTLLGAECKRYLDANVFPATHDQEPTIGEA